VTDKAIEKLIGRLGSVWSIPKFSRTVSVEFSTRMTASLGRCFPARGLVRVNATLRDGPEETLREVLAHECAHVAAYRKYGRHVKSHGREWQGLMRAAGYSPSTRLPSPGTPATAGERTKRGCFEHRCPVCQATRVARTSARRWKCLACVEDGLDGEMVVTRIG